ncbi:glycosyltransferase family 4 protein [Carboxylicivirga sp. N1Y90]|uniref:glycosyltransferase family 4 protein n=1 Tax=Carboxylicivirga fragile TaxID=3417571 RepID=UPI003D3445F9|nr:glycosyltransferase family 4 protein [Marinilabiliaceae bacterium N1Y90]
MADVRQNSICFIIPKYVTFSTGGAEIQVHYLVTEFLKRDWQVEIICGGIGKEQVIANSSYNDPRITFHYYKLRSIRSLEFFEVYKLLLRTKASYYYQRTDFALTAACALYCKRFKKTMVYAVAQDKDAHLDKYFNEFLSFKYQSKIKRWIRKVDFKVIDCMVEYGKKSSTHIVCQNKVQKELFQKNFKRDAVLIPSSYPAQSSASIEKERIVLWVSNMTSIKQAHLFIELVDQLEVAPVWRFVMIGRISLEIKEYGILPENLEFLGELSYSETESWFQRSKILVNTSKSEGMPNTFIQAWFNKVLVLGLNVDPDEVLQNKKCGVSCNGDFDRLRGVLDTAIKGKFNDELFIDNGYQYACTSFDVEKNADALIKLVQS